jgi:GNAT superfamily N-acetyltransferase
MDILRLGRNAGGQLRDVRLRVLADAPYAFSSSLERESVLGPEFWDQRVVDSKLGEAGVVFAAVDSGRAVGMAGGFSADGERQVAMLWGMWVDPDARRSGLGRALIDALESNPALIARAMSRSL